MSSSEKKFLLNIAYYSLAVIIIAFSILFMVTMTSRGVAMWQQVIYYIWACALILTIIFDIITTCNNSMKFLIGLMVTSLVFLCLIVGIIVYASMSVNGLITFAVAERFAIVIAFSVILSILTIVTYCIGEKLIDLKVEKKSK